VHSYSAERLQHGGSVKPLHLSVEADSTATARLPLRMSMAADPVLAGRHKTISRRRIRTEADEEDLRI
jgi:hypothetical protein